MEPFKVICVTCQAKLSVRNESLIGQIVACPRCESMVEVVPPAAASATVAATLPDSSPQQASPPPESAESTINLPAHEIDTPTDFAEQAPTAGVPAEAVPIEVLQTSAEVAKYKLLTWSLTSFVIGATLVGAVVYKRGSSSDDMPASHNVAQEPTSSEASNEITSTVAELAPTTPTPAQSNSSSAQTQPNIIVDPKPLVTETDERVGAETLDDAKPAPSPNEVVGEQPQPDTTTSVADSPKLTIEPAPRLARRFDPLDLDPENLTLATIDGPRDEQSEAAEIPEPDPQVAPPAVVPDEPEPQPLVSMGELTEDDMMRRDAKDQLSLTVPGVRFEALPLADALQLIAQLSGQPVSVSPEQLLMAGITSQKPVTYQGTDAQLGEVLKSLLMPLRLEYTTSGPQIVIMREGANKVREIKYPIDDLVTGDLSDEEIAGWIEQLVAPDSWQSAGGNGTLETVSGSLRITQPQHVQYQILILLERLRLARDLAPKSRYPVEQLAGAPAPIALQEKLKSKTTFTFSQFTSLEDILAHWHTELGAPLLVDWPALAGAEIWPTSTLKCAVVDEPWGVALDKVLEPCGLGWRAATGGAIEITTAKQARYELQLELFPVSRANDELIGVLKAIARKHCTNRAAAIVYDPIGKVIIASQSGRAHRAMFDQLNRENLLDVR